MAFDSRVYRILIASPSDVDDEREVAVRIIQQWNDLHSTVRKVVLLPLRWETHTAPDFGTRPQEVINRAIVDECDMLIGVFWTRIGSPTGISDSGTLEEIERVGTAGKPIMLYFSHVGIDPEKIELDQIEKLRAFRNQTFPKGLVESYRSVLEFREKFARQLEIKVRELQISDQSKTSIQPLSLNFLSTETGEAIGTAVSTVTYSVEIAGLEAVPDQHLNAVRDLANAKTKEILYIPIALGIESHSPVGIRNLYVELSISLDIDDADLKDTDRSDYNAYSIDAYGHQPSWNALLTAATSVEKQASSKLDKAFAKYQAGSLQKSENGWKLVFEWDAIQPQRLRLIKPFLFLYCPRPAEVTLKARVYRESFPQPLNLTATLNVDVKKVAVDLKGVVPDWEVIVGKSGREGEKDKPFRFD